jgi:prepilin-type N-terminal cleavage/methylation domain-containing protein
MRRTWSPPVHRGFTLLETTVALVVFAIALSGLYPLLMMQSRQLRHLEARFSAGTTYYLVPSTSAWARKLGASAQVSTVDPGPKPPPPVTLIDNADSGYAENGTVWSGSTNPQAYAGGFRKCPAGTGANAASWTFAGLQPGWYEIHITWVGAGNNATNAPFTVYDGVRNLGTVLTDQTQKPTGTTFQGSPWTKLGLFSVQGTAIQLQVTDKANGVVSADAARIVAVRNPVVINAVNRSMTGEDVTAHVSVTKVVPP